MNFILHFILLILYASAFKRSVNDDLRNDVLSLLDFNKLKESFGNSLQKPKIRDGHSLTKPGKNLEELDSGNLKSEKALSPYNDVLKKIGIKAKNRENNNHFTSKKKSLKEKKLINKLQHKIEVIRPMKSAKLINPQYVATKNPNLKQIVPVQLPIEYYKKPSKQFLLGQPNEIVFEIKPHYRYDNADKLRLSRSHDYNQDVIDAKDKAQVILRAKEHDEDLNDLEQISQVADLDRGKNRFRVDNAMNLMKKIERRAISAEEESSLATSSSSREMPKWKDQFREMHLKNKYEAVNATRVKADTVNMVAARPWGVPCGDPNQHDMPWGSCTLNIECEPEYRIYRGDHYCGRTEFVCCAMLLNNYDMYQGFDVSLDSKSLSTDSQERLAKERDEKTHSKKKKEQERKKRRNKRTKRIRKIKKNIKNIVKEMQKLLEKQFKNGTKQRKKKANQLKTFVKALKKKFKKDRYAVIDIFEEEQIRIDGALQKKLHELMDTNTNFVKNDTFREIVVNGTISKTGARMLLEAYPDLDPYLHKMLRRDGRELGDDSFQEYLEYDLEYGYLYF